MNIKFHSDYNDFTMFLSDLKIGADAIVYDKDSGYALCKVTNIIKDGSRANGNYDAEFILDNGCWMVGVNIVRTESYPNEFYDDVKDYLEKC